MSPTQSLKKIGKTILNDPNTKDPTMWMIWMLPTVGVGMLRYAHDKVRPRAEKLQRALEEMIAYSVGTFIFFTCTPLISQIVKRYTDSPGKLKFIPATLGTVMSTLYSGLWADKVAGRIVEKSKWGKAHSHTQKPNGTKLDMESKPNQQTITPNSAPTSLNRQPISNKPLQKTPDALTKVYHPFAI